MKPAPVSGGSARPERLTPIVCLLGALAVACSVRAPAEREVVAFAMENGVRVVARYEPGAPLVAIAAAVRTAQAEDRAAPGVGNLVARCLIGTNDNLSREGVARAVRFVGGGISVEYSPDCITMRCVTAPTSFSDALWILAQGMKTAAIDEEAVTTALAEVLAAQRRAAGDPVAVGEQILRARLFTGHPYAWPALGTPDGLKRLPRSALTGYYGRAFRPENTVIAVCGPVPAEAVRRSVASNFVDYGRGAGARGPASARAALPELADLQRVSATTAGSSAAVLIGFRTPGRSEETSAAVRVLATLLGGGKGSRLFRTIREEKGIGYLVGTELVHLSDAGLLYGFVQLDPQRGDGDFLDHVATMLVESFAKWAEAPVTKQERDRAVALTTGRHLSARQRLADRAAALAEAELLEGSWRRDEELPQRLEHVTAEDLQEIARRVLVHPCVVVVQPDTRRRPPD